MLVRVCAALPKKLRDVSRGVEGDHPDAVHGGDLGEVKLGGRQQSPRGAARPPASPTTQQDPRESPRNAGQEGQWEISSATSTGGGQPAPPGMEMSPPLQMTTFNTVPPSS